jgi:hypothetical protein
MSEGNPLGFHRRWTRLKPPLRPDAQIVSAYRRAIDKHDERVLLLGVTAELADLGDTLVAVDQSRKMIANAWPGDTERRKAVHGNWLTMPIERREFTAIVGDGVMAGLAFSQYADFFSQIAKVARPGAVLALRLYETPEQGEAVSQVRVAAISGKVSGFHAFKWRLAMAIAFEAQNAAVLVAEIYKTFEREFSDREALSAQTGWSLDEIGEIDAYKDKPMTYLFPTRPQFLAHLPRTLTNPRFVPSGDYELAERCPIFIAEFPS